MFRTLGFTLLTLGSVPSNVFKAPKSTVNTFDGTDPKVDRIKPKVRNTIFFPVWAVVKTVFFQNQASSSSDQRRESKQKGRACLGFAAAD